MELRWISYHVIRFDRLIIPYTHLGTTLQSQLEGEAEEAEDEDSAADNPVGDMRPNASYPKFNASRQK